MRAQNYFFMNLNLLLKKAGISLWHINIRWILMGKFVERGVVVMS